MSKIIMGISLKERMAEAAKFQELISNYGCSITTRLGLHNAGADSCSPGGLILLEFVEGADKEVEALEKDLKQFNAEVKKMVFSHI